MINRYQPHIHVLPEDDANSQLANGFLLELDLMALTKIQVLPEVGGWGAVLEAFESDHIAGLKKYADRYLILLIDCDGHEDRIDYAKQRVPAPLIDRVFILGAQTEPEKLKRALQADYETIGRDLAKDCREETDHIWAHQLLRHNANELARLRQHVCPILFPVNC